MLELSIFLWAMAGVSIATIPMQILAGIPAEQAIAGGLQWLLVLLVFILIGRKIAGRKATEARFYRISNAVLLWCVLFLILSIGMFYWQQPMTTPVTPGNPLENLPGHLPHE